ELLNAELLGHITSFLSIPDALKAEGISTEWSKDKTIQLGLKGRENEAATESLRHMEMTSRTRGVPTSLEPISSRVTKLDLSNKHITPSYLKSLAESFPYLEELDIHPVNEDRNSLEDPPKLSPNCIKALQHLPNLKKLNISNCSVTDDVLKHL